MNDSSLCDVDLDIRSVRVRYAGRMVGTLALTADGVLAFEYDDGWIREGFSISPLSLPLEKRVFVARRHPLDGVFGVFDDSLPDGWGRLLVDRLLRSHGIDPFAVSPIARLAIVGFNGMGALEYVPEIPLTSPATSTDFDELARECASVLAADGSQDLDTLFAMGGSLGGARPKVLTSIDGDDWIVKFASSQDDRDIGESEYRYALAAKACGIDMPEVRLFSLEGAARVISAYAASIGSPMHRVLRARCTWFPPARFWRRRIESPTWTTRLSCASRSS